MANNNDTTASKIVSGLCFTTSSLLFYSAYSNSRIARYIENTPEMTIKEAEEELKKNPKGIYVKLRGAVHSENPVVCEKSGEKGAVKETATFGKWISNSSGVSEYLVSRRRQANPFYITANNKTDKVLVRPWDEQQPELKTVYESTEAAHNPLISWGLGLLFIPVPFEYRHVESTLPLDSELLALGKLQYGANRQLMLSRPPSRPFRITPPGIITTRTEEEVSKEYRDNQFWSTVFGGIFSLAGAASWGRF
eukprot:TRINITY_DN720_c0_g1_i1.p1 TRINITY_DN720_c0_g1~~TRINITY_DN720_c0_g1_i1.p1  ORF type:complete len:251 (+),score=95.27 TRINITY_DN720_c0_g1_i1:86-838(+)